VARGGARLGGRVAVIEGVGDGVEVRVYAGFDGYLRRLREEGEGEDLVLAGWPPPVRPGVFVEGRVELLLV
jgi:hypothetical protein